MMRTLCLFVYSLLLIAAIGAATTSSAQERQMGGVGITIFTDQNSRGKSSTYRQDVPDLERLGLNDDVSSIRVGPGEQWEVCEHANYQGEYGNSAKAETSPDGASRWTRAYPIWAVTTCAIASLLCDRLGQEGR